MYPTDLTVSAVVENDIVQRPRHRYCPDWSAPEQQDQCDQLFHSLSFIVFNYEGEVYHAIHRLLCLGKEVSYLFMLIVIRNAVQFYQ